jgi:hypothetical protein
MIKSNKKNKMANRVLKNEIKKKDNIIRDLQT